MKKIRLTSASMLIFNITLPLILTVLLGTAGIMSSLDTYERLFCQSFFYNALEHTLMALLISVGGALLVDISVKKRSK